MDNVINITTVEDQVKRFVVSTEDYLTEFQKNKLIADFQEFYPGAKLLILEGGMFLTQIP